MSRSDRMIEISDGFINDEFAKKCEPVQGREFLYTSRQPKVGQRTETQIQVAGIHFCRLSGLVTEIGALPRSFNHTWMNLKLVLCPAPASKLESEPVNWMIVFPM